MKMIAVLASTAAVLTWAGTASVAQGAPGVRKACAADIQRLCPGIADKHAERQCMKSHMADVSPDCHSAIEAAKAARAERKAEAASAAAAAPAPAPAAPH